jgi:hypothetical protein
LRNKTDPIRGTCRASGARGSSFFAEKQGLSLQSRDWHWRKVVSEFGLITLTVIIAAAALTVLAGLFGFLASMRYGPNATPRQQAVVDTFMTGFALGMNLFTRPQKLFRRDDDPSPPTMPGSPPTVPHNPPTIPHEETKQIDAPAKLAS